MEQASWPVSFVATGDIIRAEEGRTAVSIAWYSWVGNWSIRSLFPAAILPAGLRGGHPRSATSSTSGLKTSKNHRPDFHSSLQIRIARRGTHSSSHPAVTSSSYALFLHYGLTWWQRLASCCLQRRPAYEQEFIQPEPASSSVPAHPLATNSRIQQHEFTWARRTPDPFTQQHSWALLFFPRQHQGLAVHLGRLHPTEAAGPRAVTDGQAVGSTLTAPPGLPESQLCSLQSHLKHD